ncbi:transglycosylase domain-containing protein [Archangium sp.]|uniref:transglycosylase domain-containing protein n=1 Tax=Archangium sp. TaxID=1872627 RepID=UPI00389A5FFC
MKTLLWLVLFLIGLAGVALPAIYLHAASKLPQLETEFDLEKQLRHSIEGERMSLQAGTTEHKRPVAYKRPDFGRLPKDLVALYIAQLGCPTYFQTPREDGPKWAWRLFSILAFNSEPRGDGRCERLIAVRLAKALGIEGAVEQMVAANRLHSFLQKDQLIAYDLSALYFDRGVVGVEDAAYEIFGRELDSLPLPGLAELALTLPPHYMYEDAMVCRNASLIRQNRDVLLSDLASLKLVTEERARNAMSQPVLCK